MKASAAQARVAERMTGAELIALLFIYPFSSAAPGVHDKRRVS
jgi:hypothetical protein